MDVKEFVRDTLVQISQGVRESQEIVREYGGFINPAARVASKNSSESHLTTINDGQSVFLVDFDIAVNVSEENSVGGEAKLKIASVFSASGEKGSTTESSSTSRIGFKVPLALPVDEVSKSKMLSDEAAFKARSNTATRGAGW